MDIPLPITITITILMRFHLKFKTTNFFGDMLLVGGMSHIFGSKIFVGIYIVGCDFFSPKFIFLGKNIENILYFWVLQTVTQHLQLHFI